MRFDVPAARVMTRQRVFSAAGDFLLSRPGQKMFLAGMVAFAAGHLAYIAGFWTRASELGFAAVGTVQVPMLAAL